MVTCGLDILRIDAEREVDRLARFIVGETAALRRRRRDRGPERRHRLGHGRRASSPSG